MLSIIIVSYNSSKFIANCLQSIVQSNFTGDFNIVIIDNASADKDNTRELVKSLDRNNIIFIQNSENLGFAKTINQGLKYAKEKFNSDYFLLFNPDATLHSDCLQQLTDFTKNDPSIGLLSPVIINPRNNSVWFSKGYIDWLKMKTVHQVDNERPRFSTPYITGCCLLVTRELQSKIGFLDEQFFLYYEDADYSVRARQAKFAIATNKDAICYHVESNSSDPDTKNYHLILSGLKFFRKHLPVHLMPYFWTAYAIRLLYHKFISRKTTVLKALYNFFPKTP